MTVAHRIPSAIDAVADEWVDTIAALVPTLGTYIGRTEVNDGFGDLSPEGHEEIAAATRTTLARLQALEPVDAVDEVTKADLTSELSLDLELHEAQWHLRDLNVIASAAQDVRSAFDLMPTATTEDWEVIAARLAAVPEALRGYAQTLRTGIARDVTPARRQVAEVAGQIVRYTADDGFFAEFVANGGPAAGNLPASLARTLSDNAAAARVAYDELRRFLIEELAPAASDVDAVGRELYALNSRRFLGATIDLDETYVSLPGEYSPSGAV
ncbi:MAG: DUF885 family protein [Microbacterium sp.]